jgi:hypothetical protein
VAYEGRPPAASQALERGFMRTCSLTIARRARHTFALLSTLCLFVVG